MAAVIFDNHGVFSWGWNYVDGIKSVHAEIHAINRANRRRLAGATIAVAGIQNSNGKLLLSLPCPACRRRIEGVGIVRIVYQDSTSPTGWSKI